MKKKKFLKGKGNLVVFDHTKEPLSNKGSSRRCKGLHLYENYHPGIFIWMIRSLGLRYPFIIALLFGSSRYLCLDFKYRH